MECFCGIPATLKESKSLRNNGRLYYSCQNNDPNRCNFFQWNGQNRTAPSAPYQDHVEPPRKFARTEGGTKRPTAVEPILNTTLIESIMKLSASVTELTVTLNSDDTKNAIKNIERRMDLLHNKIDNLQLC